MRSSIILIYTTSNQKLVRFSPYLNPLLHIMKDTLLWRFTSIGCLGHYQGTVSFQNTAENGQGAT